jgi:ribosome-binding protein aMBF1 (putative translation factor)
MQVFGSRIRMVRQYRGMLRYQLAAALGVPTTDVREFGANRRLTPEEFEARQKGD